MSNTFIDPSPEQGAQFNASDLSESVTMLNLLKFREIADYSASPELASDTPISGEKAYQKYIQSVGPLLQRLDAELIIKGKSEGFLIGPKEEKWDAVIIVRYNAKQDLINLTQSQDYIAIKGHRTAALNDSRLLPIKI